MENSWALVTGASSGIGKAFCYELAKGEIFDKTNIVLVARNLERLNETKGDLERNYGINCEVLTADLETKAGIGKVKKRLADKALPVRILINNAGFGFEGQFADLEIEKILAQINCNVIAVVELFHEAARSMREAGGGYILNVSSLAGFTPAPSSSTYAATKAFVTSLGLSAAVELKRYGIKVTTLCPGFTRTEFQDRAGVNRNIVPSFAWQDAQVVAKSGLRALRQQKRLVIPGIHNQAAYIGAKIMPETALSKLAEIITKRI
jgi:short-subunit dehydrogenase